MDETIKGVIKHKRWLPYWTTKTFVTRKHMASMMVLEEDRRYIVDDIASRVGISNENIYSILTKKVRLRKKYAYWVPHWLTKTSAGGVITLCSVVVALSALFYTIKAHPSTGSTELVQIAGQVW